MEIIAESKELKSVVEIANKIATSTITVLITGEEGSGRETIARYIHTLSERREGPFVTIDIAERPTNLLDFELRGYTKDAFSGALHDSIGLFRMADNGTLFLKNIQDIPPDKQVFLLRFLQERTVTSIGSLEEHTVDVRIIASAGPGLENLVGKGLFRPDLYYWLNVMPIGLLPLRERTNDIIPLAKEFLQRVVPTPPRLSQAAERSLLKYYWPGNASELMNRIQRAVTLVRGNEIDPADLGLEIFAPRQDPIQRSGELEQEVNRLRNELETLGRLTIAAVPIWEGKHFAVDSKLCFVLMPFAEVHDVQSIYSNHVKPVAESAGLRCERADDIHDISGVMQSVWEGINRARVIIADMTDRNPNVFYELGIAHTLGKRVIMITQHMDFVPSDLKHLRCIVYDYKPGKIERFEEALRKTIETVLESRPDNLALVR